MLLVAATVCRAQEIPQFPGPEKEHEWLEQLVGEWDGDVEMYMDPSKPPMKAKGTESVRSVGGFWTLGEVKSDLGGMPYTGIMTLGYDADKKKYVGTWVDSMTSHHWKYEGKLDPTGKILTLETKGPCPLRPGELSNFKEVIEIKDKDHKVFSSSIEIEDGKWQTGMIGRYTRKK